MIGQALLQICSGLLVTKAYGLDFDSDDAATDDAVETSAVAVGLHQVQINIERVEGRQRQISAHLQIPHSSEQIWQILTDYEHLADFIPNLVKSNRLDDSRGKIRIEQVGSQNFLRFKFCARVVLDMVEQFPHRLEFQMVEGDFKTFLGSWQLEPIAIAGQTLTDLTYTALVLPPRTMPIGLIERCLSSSIAMNLAAIRQRADALFGAG